MPSVLNLLHERTQTRTKTVKLKNSGAQTAVTAPQHVAVLVARLGGGERRQGERGHARVHDGGDRKLSAGIGIAVAPIEHHAALKNTVSRAALQPP